MKKIILAGILTLGTSISSFSKTAVPANPLQQRLSAPAPAPTPPPSVAPAPVKMPIAENKAMGSKAMEAKPAAKNAGAARRKQCSEEYQGAKKANTLAGQTWPKFYSACNKRLKTV